MPTATTDIPAPIAGTNTNDSVIQDLKEEMLNISAADVSVLDLGTGEGYNAWKLKSVMAGRNISITCADIDHGQFKLVRNENIRFVDFDLNKEFSFGKFDFIIATEVIEHLENPYQFIRSCLANLKEGGVLYVTTPNVANIYSVIKILLSGIPYLFGVLEKYGHITPVFPFMLEAAAQEFKEKTGQSLRIRTWYNKNIFRLYPSKKTFKMFGNHSRFFGDSAIYKITVSKD